MIEFNNYRRQISLLVVMGVLVGLLVACGGVPPSIPTEAAPTATPTSAAPTETAGPVEVVQAEVRIADFAFDTHTLTVAEGTTVTWQNEDSAPHTVTSPEGWLDSGQLASGDTFSHQFATAGTFTYHCENHPSMEGVVIVQPGGAVAPALFGGGSVEEYYADSCAGCHGINRDGATGVALIPQRLWADDEHYFKLIKEGQPGTVMPGWAALGLTDEEVWALVGLLRSPVEAEQMQWGIDQIDASLVMLVDESTLPTGPTHEGNVNNLMLVTEREARSIAVFDGDSHQLIARIPASYRAHGYTFSPTNPRWAYNMGRDGWVFKIDLYSLQPVRKVRIGLDSRAVAVSDDGRFLIAGNYVPATAVILDAETLEPLKVIETRATNPEGEMVDSRVATIVDTSPDLVGPYFLVALKEAGQVWRIDWSQPDFPILPLENVGHILHDGFLSLDNSTFYLAAQTDNWMAAIDVASMMIVARIETGAIPHPGSGAVWEVDGTGYAATVHAGEGKVTIWKLDTNEIIGSVVTSGAGLFIRAHESSPYVWADSMFAPEPHSITVFEKDPPFEIVGLITDGIRTLHPEFTADGRYAYVSDWEGNMVRVYDAETLEKVAEVENISTPTGIFSVSRRLETLGH